MQCSSCACCAVVERPRPLCAESLQAHVLPLKQYNVVIGSVDLTFSQAFAGLSALAVEVHGRLEVLAKAKHSYYVEGSILHVGAVITSPI